MAYKILENNGVDNENIDGGALNNLAAGNKSGVVANVLNECAITATGNQVVITPGMLILHGIRIKITDNEIISFSSAPSSDFAYQLVAQIIMTEEAVISFSLFAQAPTELIKDRLFVDGGGTYQIEIGRFTHQTDGTISGATRTASIIGYGGGDISTLSPVYDRIIRTQEDFDALIASPTWLDAVTVALVGEFENESTTIRVPPTVKRIDGYKCKITLTSATQGLAVNGVDIRDVEIDSLKGFGFSGNNNIYENCTGTSTASGHGFFGINNNYKCCVGTGALVGFLGNKNRYTDCIGTAINTTSSGFEGNNNSYENSTGTGAATGFKGNNNSYENCTGTATSTGPGRGFDGYNNIIDRCTCIGSFAGIHTIGSAATFMLINSCKFPSKTGITTETTKAIDITKNAVGSINSCVYNADFNISVGTGMVVGPDNFAITGLSV